MHSSERGGIVNVYVLAVLAIATCVAGALWMASHTVPSARSLAFFWLLHILAEWSPTEIPVGRVGLSDAGSSKPRPTLSAGFLVLMTAAFALHPIEAMGVGVLSALTPRDWRGFQRTVFNASQCALYTGAASAIYHVAVAQSAGNVLGILAAAALASGVASFLNISLVAGVLALDFKWTVTKAWRELSWPIPASIGFAVAALLVSLLYQVYREPAAIFLITPLIVLRQARLGKLALDDAQERTLRSFARAVEMKDPYTFRHSERVAGIVVEVHRRLGSEERDIRDRFYAALLHDLGKVGVSAHVLTKPGALSAAEFDEIKRHPGLGARAVKDIDFLGHLAEEIRHHHERIDGRGYPLGLAGNDIPFTARVLAVADTFEALTSSRPYRPALGFQEALAEMQANAGTQLDSQIVDVLVDLVGQGYLTLMDSGAARSTDKPRVASEGNTS